jgi:hypothetical protein
MGSRPQPALPYVIIAATVAIGVALGSMVESIYRSPLLSPRVAAPPDSPRLPAGPDRALGRPVPLRRDPVPWEAKPSDPPPPSPRYIPAWQVNPPRPDAHLPPPPPPPELPNPQLTTPSKHNPGGVNGDRPARPIPGLP